MKLRIHVGTEKTGSSYLQKLCGNNRQFLQGREIWFPTAGRFEKQLQKGTISPGNASDLERYLRKRDWAMVTSWLSVRVEEARESGCRRLLLSNELIFAALSDEGAIGQFERVAREVGISDISCLLMIRDPVDHALSLYKHRAKGGMAGPIDQWIMKKYPLPQQLAGFLREIDTSAIQLSMRKYEKSTESIVTAFFHDWLDVDTPPVPIESLVNPSLTLSELAVIRHIVANRAEDQQSFYAKFLSVPVDKKANDDSANRLALATLERYLCRFNEFWIELDRRLDSDGGLEVPQTQKVFSGKVVHYVFSEAQLDAWTQAHAESGSSGYALNLWLKSSLRPGVGKLIRKIMPGFGQR